MSIADCVYLLRRHLDVIRVNRDLVGSDDVYRVIGYVDGDVCYVECEPRMIIISTIPDVIRQLLEVCVRYVLSLRRYDLLLDRQVNGHCPARHGNCVIRARPIDDNVRAGRAGNGITIGGYYLCDRTLKGSVAYDRDGEVYVNCPMDTYNEALEILVMLYDDRSINEGTVGTVKRVNRYLCNENVTGTDAAGPAFLRFVRLDTFAYVGLIILRLPADGYYPAVSIAVVG